MGGTNAANVLGRRINVHLRNACARALEHHRFCRHVHYTHVHACIENAIRIYARAYKPWRRLVACRSTCHSPPPSPPLTAPSDSLYPPALSKTSLCRLFRGAIQSSASYDLYLVIPSVWSHRRPPLLPRSLRSIFPLRCGPDYRLLLANATSPFTFRPNNRAIAFVRETCLTARITRHGPGFSPCVSLSDFTRPMDITRSYLESDCISISLGAYEMCFLFGLNLTAY